MTDRFIRFTICYEPLPRIAHLLGHTALPVGRYVAWDLITRQATVYYATTLDDTRVRCLHGPLVLTYPELGNRLLGWLSQQESVLPGWPEGTRTCADLPTACHHDPTQPIPDDEIAAERIVSDVFSTHAEWLNRETDCDA